ncbi:MAG: manganese efflux pump MntP family protein [Candidatus Bathyarchaeia archaeon]|nr:manganese efflux pump [Candidatus Bathyarchaeota archaeon]
MDVFYIILIAVCLALDASAVSIANGMCIRPLRLKDTLAIAGSFGIFQAVMPLVGWLIGSSLLFGVFSMVDHWIVFSLLFLIGCRMVYESRNSESRFKDALSIDVLIGLSIATSMDALAVGVTFAILKVAIATPMIIIGLVTFILSFLGVLSGNRIGSIMGFRIGLLGGLILIGTGIKILIEHLS